MQSLKSPYILYNQQSVGSTLHNNLLFITDAALLVGDGDDLWVHRISPRFCLSCLVLEIEKAATTFLKKE